MNMLYGLMGVGILLLVLLVFRKPIHKKAYQVFFNQIIRDKSVPIMRPSEIDLIDKRVFLDCREPEEYAVSQIEGAMFFGYKNKNYALLETIDKHDTILAYCTVGYRSQMVAKELNEMGYLNVYNLSGGLFEWLHIGKKIVDRDQITSNIHPYDAKWGLWLAEGNKVYE